MKRKYVVYLKNGVKFVIEADKMDVIETFSGNRIEFRGCVTEHYINADEVAAVVEGDM